MKKILYIGIFLFNIFIITCCSFDPSDSLQYTTWMYSNNADTQHWTFKFTGCDEGRCRYSWYSNNSLDWLDYDWFDFTYTYEPSTYSGTITIGTGTPRDFTLSSDATEIYYNNFTLLLQE